MARLSPYSGKYPDYVAASPGQIFLRQSAVRQETGRYHALFEEGLIHPGDFLRIGNCGVTSLRAPPNRARALTSAWTRAA